MAVSQQTVGGDSCGACAASYVLQEFLNQVLTINDIRTLWNAVQFDNSRGHTTMVSLGPLTVYWDHTDPTKLCEQLTNRGLHSVPYRSSSSPLSYNNNAIDAYLHKAASIKNGTEGMGLLSGGNRRAIGIYTANGGLHYVLTKFTINKYWIRDSNARFPSYVEGPLVMSAGTTFQASVDNLNVTYRYLGACLVIYK